MIFSRVSFINPVRALRPQQTSHSSSSSSLSPSSPSPPSRRLLLLHSACCSPHVAVLALTHTLMLSDVIEPLLDLGSCGLWWFWFLYSYAGILMRTPKHPPPSVPPAVLQCSCQWDDRSKVTVATTNLPGPFEVKGGCKTWTASSPPTSGNPTQWRLSTAAGTGSMPREIP